MSNSSLSWGEVPTQFFFKLTPDRVLDAVESIGLPTTGRCFALGSMENRVYEVELEIDDPSTLKSPSERFRIAKFYRPGRWTKEQILEEHEFLLELQKQEIPVICPIPFQDGSTLKSIENDIHFCIFPKCGGRAPDELSDEQLTRLGRLLARIHSVGAVHPSKHRIQIDPQTYALKSLEFLKKGNFIPDDYLKTYEDLVLRICEKSQPWFNEAAIQRIHGDCHFGNQLWNDQGPFFLDFDDFVMGPPIQDLWLLIPGRDEEAKRQFQVLLSAYEQMKTFDHRTLKLIEPLRALRFIHFSAWMAKRWEDPIFPRNFPQFGTSLYWQEQVQDLREILALIHSENPWN